MALEHMVCIESDIPRSLHHRGRGYQAGPYDSLPARRTCHAAKMETAAQSQADQTVKGRSSRQLTSEAATASQEEAASEKLPRLSRGWRYVNGSCSLF